MIIPPRFSSSPLCSDICFLRFAGELRVAEQFEQDSVSQKSSQSFNGFSKRSVSNVAPTLITGVVFTDVDVVYNGGFQFF